MKTDEFVLSEEIVNHYIIVYSTRLNYLLLILTIYFRQTESIVHCISLKMDYTLSI